MKVRMEDEVGGVGWRGAQAEAGWVAVCISVASYSACLVSVLGSLSRSY